MIFDLMRNLYIYKACIYIYIYIYIYIEKINIKMFLMAYLIK